MPTRIINDQQMREARGLLDFLAGTVPTENNAYGILLSNELQGTRDKQDYYLYHEYLEDINEPLYFHQFMDRAQAAGLQYLGEADFSTMSASSSPSRQRSL